MGRNAADSKQDDGNLAEEESKQTLLGQTSPENNHQLALDGKTRASASAGRLQIGQKDGLLPAHSKHLHSTSKHTRGLSSNSSGSAVFRPTLSEDPIKVVE